MTKQAKVSKKLVKAVEALLSARAKVKEIRPIVEGYQRQILADNQWSVAKEWQRIERSKDIVTDPRDTHSLTDKDARKYFKLCRIEAGKNGLKVEQADQCPLLVAEYNVKKAEDAVLGESMYITGLASDRWWKLSIRNQAIDLIVNLVEAHNRESSK